MAVKVPAGIAAEPDCTATDAWGLDVGVCWTDAAHPVSAMANTMDSCLSRCDIRLGVACVNEWGSNRESVASARV
jgi:hypothetical protein